MRGSGISRLAGAVTNDVEAEFAVRSFNGVIDLARWPVGAFGHQLELIDQLFHPAEDAALGGPTHPRIVGVHGTDRNLIEALRDDSAALADLFHPYQVAVEVVAMLADRHVEIDLAVSKIRLRAAQVVRKATRPQ